LRAAKFAPLARILLDGLPELMTVDDLVTTTRSLGQALRAMAGLGIRNRRLYDDLLREVLLEHPEVYGTWTVWEPGALDQRDERFRHHPGHDATGRYLPFWFRDGRDMVVEPNTNYENTDGLGEYYQIPRRTCDERTVRFSEYIPLSGRRQVFTCHIVPLLQADRFLGVAGIDVFPEAIEPSAAKPLNEEAGLSPRENEVLEWIAAGKTNAEIGIILGVSVHTVKRHVERVLEKLGVENRRAAMLAFLQREAGAR
jgi:DNA-binding CsgD family transcriptional regulator